MSAIDKLVKLFADAGWEPSPASLTRSMGSALFAFASIAIPAATWRIRIGERVSHLERRAHGTPTGRCSAGHWEAVGTIDTPRSMRLWADMIEALTGEALAYETTLGVPVTSLPSGSQHTRRGAADGGEYGGTSHGRGRVGTSNPSRLGAFGFAPAAGFGLLAGKGELIDANPECDIPQHRARVGFRTPATKIRAARNVKRNAKRKARRYAQNGGN